MSGIMVQEDSACPPSSLAEPHHEEDTWEHSLEATKINHSTELVRDIEETLKTSTDWREEADAHIQELEQALAASKIRELEFALEHSEFACENEVTQDGLGEALLRDMMEKQDVVNDRLRDKIERMEMVIAERDSEVFRLSNIEKALKAKEDELRDFKAKYFQARLEASKAKDDAELEKSRREESSALDGWSLEATSLASIREEVDDDLGEDMEALKQNMVILIRAYRGNQKTAMLLKERVELLDAIKTHDDETIEFLKKREAEIFEAREAYHKTAMMTVQEAARETGRANESIALLERTVDEHEATERVLKAKIECLEESQKALTRAHGREVAELTATVAAQKEEYNRWEVEIKGRERDVRVREDAVNSKEHELKSQPRQTKESAKESAKVLKIARTQLKASEARATDLESKLQSAADEHQILKLDYETTVSELEALKAASANPNHDPREEIQEQLRKLKEDRDKFRGLYESTRSTEPIIKDRIAQAVHLAKEEMTAVMNNEIDALKAKAEQTARETATEMQALEKKVSETSIAAEARISEIVRDADERIKDLSRAKVALVAENMAKDGEIERLKQQLTALASSKTLDDDQ
ncbi:hypothetical protein L207DRAFT_640499 [Hyaloscypha variabilis F]|uniref:Uncharacterized protein n=1 Tax=Hyaloscypha variabilis (strain UAMH 11265 / GT02V1 / F) TaxID=1149755 RepID=A0A2J6R133_HYAVF|nr:hypothetical protein L207DRAFT_640499 [Hyaloscypha variabilis F]